MTLLERERELSELTTALRDAWEGRGRFVLVEAPAGLGKSSLVRAALDDADGFAVLRARANELERDFAYGCVRQLLEAPAARHPDLFDGAAIVAEALFKPFGSDDPDLSFTMLHGLYWMLSNLADRGPVVVAVDDAHWADEESLRFLSYLAPRLDGLAVAVFACTRAGDAATARLAADPELRVIRPGPLSLEATAGLCGPDATPEFAAACCEATGGNPFFLHELLREVRVRRVAMDDAGAARVRAIGPATVARAVLLRVAGHPQATALVRAAAILGDGATLAEAAALVELDQQDAAHAADELITLAVLKPAPKLEFAHPIVREAVYADIGAHERAQAHARAALILTSQERAAAQLVQAEPAGDASRVELLRRVADEALRRGAPAAAIAWLRRADAELPQPRADVLFELGTAELRLGKPEAADHLAAALALTDDAPRLAMTVRRLAMALSVAGRSDEAVDAVEGAIDVIAPLDRELGLLLEAELASHAQQASPSTRARAAARLWRHEQLKGATPGERLVLASLALERAKASESEYAAAERLADALAGGHLLREQRVDLAGPFYDLVVALLATDALDIAEADLELAVEEARARASAPHWAHLTCRRGWVALRRGNLTGAEAAGSMSLELLVNHGIALGQHFALALLVQVLVEKGEFERADAALEERDLCAELRPGLTNNFLLEARALLRIAEGRTRDGLDDLLEFGRRDELWGGANPLASRWRSRAALAHVALGDAEEGAGMAAIDLERARRWGSDSGLGTALRANALIAGSPDGLREAVAAFERSPARLEHARALTDLGAALRRANRRAEAREALLEGLRLAEQCAADPLAELARTELLAAGGRTSDPTGTGVERLTVSERRVAELAAEGRSNPEIAQTLYVTRKTVETHLGHVYRKLDVAGRGDLARALAESGS